MSTIPYLCSVSDCTRKENFKKSGLCRPHYLRKSRGSANWDGPLTRQDNMAGSCTHPGCELPVRTTGYCNAHYIRYRMEKPMDGPIPDFYNRARVCPVDDCGREVRARGMCATHYQRVKLGYGGGPIKMKDPLRGCKIEGCEKKHDGNGYCGTHGYTQRKYRLSDDQMRKLYQSVCEICGLPESQKRSMSVDHDHSCCPGDKSCGKCVRGFLCSNCNRALGLFADDPNRLKSAVAYLSANGIE